MVLALGLNGCASDPTPRTEHEAAVITEAWQTLHESGFTLHYKPVDEPLCRDLLAMIVCGRERVRVFFNKDFAKAVDVFVYPDRDSLTAHWRAAWSMPDLRPELWMVASGSANELSLLSPRVWATEAIEHDFSDKPRTEALLAHELTHVFHAQQLPDQSFDGMDDAGWFVEGLAVHASRQLDLGHLASASEAITVGKAPQELRAAWSGKYKYGICGSLVRYVDQKRGRAKIIEMLRAKTADELLSSIGCSEQELLASWKEWVVAGSHVKPSR
jgi:hypothetical protein